MTHSSAFEEFLELAKPNLERGCAAIFACVHVKSGGRRTNLAANLVLVPATNSLEGHAGEKIFEIGDFGALRVVVPPEKVLPLLRALAEGQLDENCLPPGCGEIHFPGREEGAPLDFGASAIDVEDLDEFGLPFVGHVLTAYGPSNEKLQSYDAWRDFEARLPAQDPPFSHPDSVLADLHIGGRLRHRDLTTLSIVAPYWCAITSAQGRLSEATISVEIATHWHDLDPTATISLIPRDSLLSDRKQRLALSDGGWQTAVYDDRTLRLSREIPIGESVGPLDVSLNWAGRQIQRETTGLGSARVLSHELIDTDFAALRRRLFERKGKNDPGRHEEGVAWLLHLCGLSAARYGYKDMQRATDVVAFMGDYAAIYAECTLELPGLAKLKDVESRAEALRNRLEQRYGRSITLVRAIFVPHERRDIDPQDFDAAHEQAGAIYICRDDMEELIEMARRGESAAACFWFIAQRGRERNTVRI